jgi:hypothetical protein
VPQPTPPPPGPTATIQNYSLVLKSSNPSETYTFTVSGTYYPLAGQKMPSNLLVEQNASAQAPLNQTGSYSASGFAADGVGDSSINQSSSTPYTTYFNAGSQGSHLVAAPGGSFSNSVTATMSLSGTAPGWTGAADYGYYVQGADPELEISGPITDSSGGQDILIGQQCSATIADIPTNWTATAYNWSVSSDTVSSFYVSPAQFPAPAQQVGYPVPVSNSTWVSQAPNWYWSDNEGSWGSATAETVSVSALLTDNTGNSFPYVGTESVNVWAPTANFTPVASAGGGYETDSTYTTNFLGLLDGISSYGPNHDYGMQFLVFTSTPDLFLSEGPGATICAQLTNYYVGSNLYATTTQGQWMLDNVYPDGETGSAGAPPKRTALDFVDSPIGGGLSAAVGYVDANSYFQTYVLYAPPGTNSLPVPLYLVNWDWIASVSQVIPYWPDVTGGTAITGNSYTTRFPIWNNIFLNI